MKAVFLVRKGVAGKAFEIREIPVPEPQAGQVLIKVEAFGLNFADVMARNGMYKEAPPIPCVLGYDVTGTIESIGAGVENVKTGDRITALTRFGGYAEYAVTNANATAKIPGDMHPATATAMSTQCCTAYFAAAEMVNLHPGNKVLIQSGAGGVGTALIQYAKYRQCEIFSTAGSDEKLQYLSGLGVHYPINYRTQDFEAVVKKITNGKGVDVVFDAVGGKSVKKGFRILASGGRIVCFGAAAINDQNLIGKIKTVFSFGIYHPLMFMTASKSMIGINMLRIADDHPLMIQHCLESVIHLNSKDVFVPAPGKIFPVSEIAAAHKFIEKRKSIGKVAVTW